MRSRLPIATRLTALRISCAVPVMLLLSAAAWAQGATALTGASVLPTGAAIEAPDTLAKTSSAVETKASKHSAGPMPEPSSRVRPTRKAGEPSAAPLSVSAKAIDPITGGASEPTPALPAPMASRSVRHAKIEPPAIVSVSQDPRPSLHPEIVVLTARAAARYGMIADQGGWPSLPADAKLVPGAASPLVPLLRRRLMAEDDLQGGDPASPLYDPGVTAAVRRFQGRHGLAQTGAIGAATLKALNVTAARRFQQLAATLDRMNQLDFPFGPRYVAVNIPSATVEAIADGRVERRYVAVVGDLDHPSPSVEARIGTINFNPTWTVPVSIIRKEIIPHMRKDPTYLSKSNIRMIGASGTEIDPAQVDWSSEKAVNYTLRQDAGASNALGIVRIDMPNRYTVYMHDTPSKRHFGRDLRFLSHGCVRVADVLDLAAWLLAPSGWTREQVDVAVASKERRDARLTQPVPVAWIYMTGYASADGMVHFRDDVYGLDGPPAPQAQPPAPVPVAAR